MMSDRPWWHAQRHADRRPGLLARGRIKAAIRRWFEAQGFVEIEAGALVVSPGNETHLKAFPTRLDAPDASSRAMYLHTSPEFAAKKLIAAGETKIFTFAPVYRNNERGPLHAPEFTMLEWYRAEPGSDYYEAIQADCKRLIEIAAETVGNADWQWKNRKFDAAAANATLTVPQLISELFPIDILDTIPGGTPDRDALARAAARIDISAADDETWGDIFSKLMVEAERRYGELPAIVTRAGQERTLILSSYPAHMSPHARPLPADTRLAGRFEAFAAGIELANGFSESNDAEMVRTGLAAEMDEKQRLYAERYPLDEDFLNAVARMPVGTAGCALGFDRLVMLATGATHIDQVLWTPLEQ
ncbi:MAG: EF-P lysine aminoacylase GenX [Alphaproteobacteria bacterium]|nr:EF-P lysine aminoacylase GenX [Alphaproteobacteria bacterium]